MLLKQTTTLGLATAAVLALAGSAWAGGTLRVAMTASDVPTTTGSPDNGGEGLRFLGFPVFESLVAWDLTRADKLADIRSGLAESWEQDKTDRTKWIFHLRKGVKFHDGTDWNADAAIWNLEKSTDPEQYIADIQKAHEIFVDDPPWVFIVHDRNARAMTKHVKGFVSAQSWFQDFTPVYME